MKNSVPKIIYPSPALQQLLANVYDEWHEAENPAIHAKRRQDFVFHMTDWLNDLQNLQELYAQPEQADPNSASRFMAGFLYHVIPHLKAAGRLLLKDIPDAFAESGENS